MVKTSSDFFSEVFGNLRLSSEIFGKRFVNVPLAFRQILENLRKMFGNLLKIAKNGIRYCDIFYIIKRKLHGCLNIRNFSSRVEIYKI